jgi:hypothetical protein
MEDDTEHTAVPDEIISTRLVFQHGAVDAMLDTSAISIWTTMEVFTKAVREHFQADVRLRAVWMASRLRCWGTVKYIITFQLWGVGSESELAS